MRVLIVGAAGFIGRKTAEAIARAGAVGGKPVTEMVLADMVTPDAPSEAAFPITLRMADLSDPTAAAGLVADRPDIVLHLAAIVSGEAETDFEKGYRINLDGTRHLLDAIRVRGHVPRLIFTSSIAVFGAPFPEAIPDDFHLTPRTSYGTQKAMSELLVEDYSRKGLLDGVSIRLPTICVRPGRPNKAASSFFSGIIREPLAGEEAICPVAPDVRHWVASPRSAVGFLLHAATLPGDRIADGRALTMPGISITVGEMIEALGRVAGKEAVARIRMERDPFIEEIVPAWPRRFEPRRALGLGFVADDNFDDIVRAHIEDELGGRPHPA